MREHGPEHVSSLAREGDDSLNVMLSLTSLAVVVGPAVGMAGEGTKGALIEDFPGDTRRG